MRHRETPPGRGCARTHPRLQWVEKLEDRSNVQLDECIGRKRNKAPNNQRAARSEKPEQAHLHRQPLPQQRTTEAIRLALPLLKMSRGAHRCCARRCETKNSMDWLGTHATAAWADVVHVLDGLMHSTKNHNATAFGEYTVVATFTASEEESFMLRSDDQYIVGSGCAHVRTRGQPAGPVRVTLQDSVLRVMVDVFGLKHFAKRENRKCASCEHVLGIPLKRRLRGPWVRAARGARSWDSACSTHS